MPKFDRAVPAAALAFLVSVAEATDSAHVLPAPTPADPAAWLEKYCSRCHNDTDYYGGFSISELAPDDVPAGRNLARWERVLRRSSDGEMPPRDRPQPPAALKTSLEQWLEGSLDARAQARPDPGRSTLRRLNRAEYANAVRDLLALDVNVADALPADDSGYGFDNIADVLSVSSTLMDRYLSVAGRLSRLAVGSGVATPYVTTYQVPKDGSVLNQGIPSWYERASDELPLDSRGGAVYRFYAPLDATYEISGWLNANTNNEVDRLPEARVSLRLPLKAGSHSIGITFDRLPLLDETVQTLHNDVDYVWLPVRPPTQLPVQFVVDGATAGRTAVPSYFMSPRYSQANFPRDVLQIDVDGPYEVKGPGDTPSRRRIFQCRPTKPSAEPACARQIIQRLARQAWRRPVAGADIAPLIDLYTSAREGADFERGIQTAIEGLLVSPGFLFLHEADPAGAAPGTVHPISDLEFASRLALFLWSSLPDDELITLAAKGRLRRPAVLGQQVQRMLADPRGQALTTNFAGQWLYLRNLELLRPDVYLFPDFNTRLRRAMKQESELFFSSIVRENRSVLQFIESDYTFLNEPLAAHYGIKGVKGPAMRRVKLDEGSPRGGLLGQASILTVTSYANHTSVVKRGQWILTNLLSAPPPAPPPDVPALKSEVNGRQLSPREQLEMHRADAACSSCHEKMDPLGYALENFDAVGAWRNKDGGHPIDVTARLADGTPVDGVAGLRKVLLQRRDGFTRAFTERLLTYALGRGVEPQDMPTVRAIARRAAADDYRIQSVIMGIVESEPFNLRRSPES